jgi:hypothetical protein
MQGKVADAAASCARVTVRLRRARGCCIWGGDVPRVLWRRTTPGRECQTEVAMGDTALSATYKIHRYH